MSQRTPTACQHGRSWSRAHHGAAALSALTGQDSAAFAATCHLVELWMLGDAAGKQAAVAALRTTLSAMQGSTRELARYALAAQDEWVERELWPLVAPGILQPLQDPATAKSRLE